MYKELDEYLSGLFTEDYWYDEGVVVAQEILLEFGEGDWNKLLDDIFSKPIEWQIRFAYCADNEVNDEVMIKTLILLAEIDNDELFVTCIDSLRCIINSDNIGIIFNDKLLIKKVEKIFPKCDIATKEILEDFIYKFNNE